MEIETYNGLKYYLEKLEYPPNCTKQLRRTIRSQNKYYQVQNDKLYRQGRTPRLVLTKTAAHEAIFAHHSHALGGHYAFDNTYYKIKQKYYVPGLTKMIRDYINQCDRCQRQASKNNLEPLNPIPVTAKIFHHVQIDAKFVKRSRGGYRYILSCFDLFSKYVESKAVCYLNGAEVSMFILNKIIANHSVPKIIHVDGGGENINAIVKSICKQYNIEHRKGSPYNSRSQGGIERWHRSLNMMIKRLPNEEKQDWDLYLDALLFAYRTIKQASTKQSPFFMIYGRHPYIPFDNNYRTEIPMTELAFDQAVQEEFSKHVEKLQNVRNEAAVEIKHAQEKQKKQIDQKILKKGKELKRPFKIGDHVEMFQSWVANTWSGKIIDRWTGIFLIHKINKRGTYKLKQLNGQVLNQSIHGNRLRIYRMPNTEYRMPSYQASSSMITNDQGTHSKQKERASNLEDENSSDNLNESNEEDYSSTTNTHDEDPTYKNRNTTQTRVDREYNTRSDQQDLVHQSRRNVKLRQVTPYIHIPVKRIFYE